MLSELTYKDSVATLKLNNPKKLNALSCDLMSEIHEKVAGIEQKAKVLVITGGEKTFAAGVDVAEIHMRSYEEAYLGNFIDHRWECIFNVSIPVIAAVSGYALGGGFELALVCDIIVASQTAVFGFPEVNLGIMPGMGGTQMLTKIVGPKVASEIMMTGRHVSAEEAFRLGIVSHIVDNDKFLDKALSIADDIARKSLMSTRLIKDAVRLAQNVGLHQGIASERQMFRSLFSTSFKQEGTKAFLEKRQK